MPNPFAEQLLKEPVESVSPIRPDDLPEPFRAVAWFIANTLEDMDPTALPVRLLYCYWGYLEYEAQEKLWRLPDDVRSDLGPFFDLDLGAVRYAEGIKTLGSGRPVTIGYHIFIPTTLNLSSAEGLDTLLHELRHAEQFTRSGGIREHFEAHLEESAEWLRSQRAFDPHRLVALENDAAVRANVVREAIGGRVRPPVCPYAPPDGDALYAGYRMGLITRHLCANGRVDQSIWLRQVKGDFPAGVRTSYNLRRRFERYSTSGGDESEPAVMEWEPLSRAQLSEPEPGCIAVSYANGENALMVTGLSLAAFSLEAIGRTTADGAALPASRHALEYARQMFEFILSSEMPGRGGYFLRVESPHPKHQPFLSSTDDVLGICVGLRYYFEATANDPTEQGRVVELVRRMGRLFGSHGYWIVPWADDYWRNSVVADRLFYRSPDAEDSVFTSQSGWAFGYAFRRFFQYITGDSFTAVWDDGEKSAYVQSVIPLGGAILGWVNSQYVGLIDPLHTTTPKSFRRTCEWIAKLAQGDPTITIGDVTEEVMETGDLAGEFSEAVADKVKGLLFSEVAEKNFFNFNMLALATVLLLECEGDKGAIAAAGTVFHNLLKRQSGWGNALFAVVMRACRAANGVENSTAEADAAIQILVTPPRDDVAAAFEHDLSLHDFSVVPNLLSAPGGQDAQAVSAALARPEEEWRAQLDGWNLPIGFNLSGHWGGTTVWTSKASNRVVGGMPTNPGGTDVAEISRVLFSATAPLAMTLEDCAAGFVFARMLAARVGVLPLPVFDDRRWAMLPFAGAVPVCVIGNQSTREVHNALLRVDKCRLDRMADRNVVRFRSYEQARRHGYDNCAYCIGDSEH